MAGRTRIDPRLRVRESEVKRGLHRFPSTCVWELQRDALGWRITEGAGLAMLTRIALLVALSG
jgi:hypothetical protein